MKVGELTVAELPLDVLHVLLSQWITTDDLARVDSAACNKRFRKVFLEIVQKPYFATEGFPSNTGTLTMNCIDGRYSLFLQWMLMRQVQVQVLDLSLFSTVKHMNMQVGSFLSQVKSLKVSLEDKDTRQLAETVLRNCAHNIQFLDLGSKVGDHDLSRFRGIQFPALQKLTLLECKASGRGTADFLQRTPQLQNLVLDRTSEFNEDVVSSLRYRCPKLKTLSLRECKAVSLEALSTFPAKSLSTLDLSASALDSIALTKYLPQLVRSTRNLNLSKASGLSPEALQAVSREQFLDDKVVDIRHCPIKISLELREKLSNSTGLFVLGI